MRAFVIREPSRLRTHLGQSRVVFEPRADATGALHWVASEAHGEDRSWAPDPRPPLLSSKHSFFAQRERLFAFDGKHFVETVPAVTPFALFGVHACDLVAIAYQDRFFREDPYYRTRREAALLVGIDCVAACEHGFCSTVDAGPSVRPETADLALAELGAAEGWLVVAMTEAGERALEGLELQTAPADWWQRRAAIEHRAAATFSDASHITDGVRRLDAGEVPEALWDRLGLQCFSCSGCTQVCPTCSCFTTFDAACPVAAEAFERWRTWDSCLFEGFQKEASGHNPAARPGQRVARFWYHKFSKDFVRDFGRYGCVGCGRCEVTCLGVIGVHSAMKRIVS